MFYWAEVVTFVVVALNAKWKIPGSCFILKIRLVEAKDGCKQPSSSLYMEMTKRDMKMTKMTKMKWQKPDTEGDPNVIRVEQKPKDMHFFKTWSSYRLQSPSSIRKSGTGLSSGKNVFLIISREYVELPPRSLGFLRCYAPNTINKQREK